MGTPVVTCECAVCRSKDPHDRRLRPAGLMTVGGKRLLFDTGPDFREQALKIGLRDLDGVVLTHTHFDHIAGIDDLRVYYFIHNKTLPCMLSQESYDDLKLRYSYFFKKSEDDVMGPSRFDFQILKGDFGTAEFLGLKWGYLSYHQNQMKVTGYRLGKFAYVLDIRDYSEKIVEALKGVEVLVLSALRLTPSPAHLSLEEAVEFARKVGAKMTWFSHIAHNLGHEEGNKKLPPNIRLAYDGLEIIFNVD
jgi:phosphoribosyl 1,2-cyclic phosphate phosphodiesterase